MSSRLAAILKGKIAIPFFLLFLLFCVAPFTYGQDRVVKGRVTGADNLPLEGVSVVAVQSSKGTVTDREGRFSLRLPATDAMVIFSHLGFSSDTVRVKDEMNVVLSSQNNAASQLNPVVVVGYGTLRKRSVTGSVGVVSSESMENQAVRDVGQALQGQIAGVQVTQASGNPSSSPTITIRGLGTFGANPNPLIVIDGIITEFGLQDINPDDIDNISVLKDASAAAIYGSQGANGVVLVTTRRGRKGRSDIDVSVYAGQDQVSHKIPVLNATQFATIVNGYYVNGGSAAPFANPSSYGKGTNWQNEIFRNAQKENVSLAFRGGSEKSTYSVGLGAAWTDGIVINSKNTKYSLSVNNDIMPLKGLKISNTFLGSYSVEKEGNSQMAVSTAMQYAPTIPAYKPDGSFGIASQTGEPITINAPLVEALIPVNSYGYTRALDNLALEYEILPGLKFRTEGGLEYYQQNVTSFIPSYNYGLGNQVATASLDRNISYAYNLQTNDLLTYNKVLGDHSFDALAGYTFQSSRNENLEGYRENFSRNDPNLQVLNAGSANDKARGNISEWDVQSYIGRLNYAYKNRYILTSTLRIDQSSRFAASHRTGYFPSFSAAWIVSDESFMRDLRGLSFLKIRAGYGKLGNQNIGTYPYQASVSPGLNYVFADNVSSGYAPTGFVNENISWERTRTTGAGVDANFLNNRLRFILDYYDRFTSGILLQVPIPGITGVSSNPAYQNAGEVTNKGFEFTVGYGNMGEKKDLTYNVGVNFTYNHNQVTSLESDESLIYANTRTVKGQSINSFYGYVMQGIFQNQQEISGAARQTGAQPGDIRFKDLNHDGVISDSDRTFLGSSMPTKSFGLNGQVRYKDFDLSVSAVGEWGAWGLTQDNGFDINRAGEQNAAIFLKTWTGEGTSNNFPRLVAGDPNNNGRASSFYLARRDFFRLKNVQLGYNLKTRSSSVLKRARIYIAAQNLFTITKWPGFDPELSNLTSTYPMYRSLYAGINIGL
ncbi:MAG TPA: TonB-dependent receptor [Puia sp.]|jgi:TonB-linked SusC/RagA family outer membrane protein